MLENELLLITRFKNNRVFVERSDAACQFHSTDEIDGDIVPLLSCRVEEGILNVLLCRLGFHLPISLFRVRCCAMSLGRIIIGYSSPVGSYNTALPQAFQLPEEQYSQERRSFGRNQRSVSGFRKNRSGFISIASHLQSSVPHQSCRVRSLDREPHQPAQRLQHQPPYAVSLAAFHRRHNLARPFIFL